MNVAKEVNLPEILFDFEFNLHQNLDDLEDFLNEFDFNLNSNQKELCQITFAFEKIILFELENTTDNRVKSRIKNILLQIDEIKNDFIGLIKIILNRGIYYNLTNNKKNQAVVLRSVSYFFIKSLPSKIYVYALNTGLDLVKLAKWNELKFEKSIVPKEDVFLSGSVPPNYTRIDVYNNNLQPPVIHSIWLSPNEYHEFEKELKKDRDFGGKSKFIMREFPGEDTFEATIFLSENVLFQKVIPTAIWNTYWKAKSGKLDEIQAAQSLAIDLLYVGHF